MELTRENLKDFGIVPEGDVIIPDGVTLIAESAFKGTSLRSIKIPDSVTNIRRFAFKDCKNLESVELSKNTRVIEVSAFEGCSSLKFISIPDMITNVEFHAFHRCSDLTIEFPKYMFHSTDEHFDAANVILRDSTLCDVSDRSVDKIVLTRNDIIKYHILTTGKVFIPEIVRDDAGGLHRVAGIGTGAFYNCKDLELARLPEYIHIDTGAFMGCTNAHISISSTTLSIANHAFDGVKSIDYNGNLPGAPWGARDMN